MKYRAVLKSPKALDRPLQTISESPLVVQAWAAGILHNHPGASVELLETREVPVGTIHSTTSCGSCGCKAVDHRLDNEGVQKCMGYVGCKCKGFKITLGLS